MIINSKFLLCLYWSIYIIILLSSIIIYRKSKLRERIILFLIIVLITLPLVIFISWLL